MASNKYKYSGAATWSGFTEFSLPKTTIITPRVVKIKKVTCCKVIVSLRKVNANTVQHIGDKLFTTPISVSGIRYIQALLIKLPTEP